MPSVFLRELRKRWVGLFDVSCIFDQNKTLACKMINVYPGAKNILLSVKNVI